MLSRADERHIVALHRRDQREKRNSFLAEGIRVAEDLLDAGVEIDLVVTSPALEQTERGRRLTERLSGLGSIRSVTDAELGRISATETPQGVLIIARIPHAEPGALQLDSSATLLVLDAVQDPGNFGALARSADAFGVTAVFAFDGTVDPWNAKVVRAAAGSTFRVPVIQVDAATGIEWLQSKGVHVLVADARGTPVRELDVERRVAPVVGNEGAGVRDLVRNAATATIAVPVRGNVDSLNVAVAGGILLYELIEARKP